MVSGAGAVGAVVEAGGEPVAIGVLAPTSTVARLAVVPAILASSKCRLAAVASRSRPDDEPPGGARRHAGYDDLVADPEVEAVYVPLPNSMHREWTERAAAAGKHVLCEKPLSPSATDSSLMSAACADAGVVLMEAYMTPFHPRSRAVVELARSGRLGEILFVSTAFTGVLDRPDDHRWRPEMGGGCLLDVGIYCLAPVPAILSLDTSAVAGLGVGAAAARRTSLGVDSTFSGWLDLGGGRSAGFQCSFEAPERQLLEIVGTDAAAFVERAFTPSLEDRTIELRHRDGSVEVLTTGGGDPYGLMVDQFCSVVRGTAVAERTPADSIALAGLVDRLLAAAGRVDDR
ncbi:MAG TPA: Gfo/Idh/MocA family oxidoreductase [Acidimicrobiales bacterium]|nr:Gfo/Idh/MocA family oxidoreductase [Acidimicrobiales bacterium]